MINVSFVCPAGRVKMKSAKVHPSIIVVSPETVGGEGPDAVDAAVSVGRPRFHAQRL